jgi:hypothetical protein
MSKLELEQATLQKVGNAPEEHSGHYHLFLDFSGDSRLEHTIEIKSNRRFPKCSA